MFLRILFRSKSERLTISIERRNLKIIITGRMKTRIRYWTKDIDSIRFWWSLIGRCSEGLSPKAVRISKRRISDSLERCPICPRLKLSFRGGMRSRKFSIRHSARLSPNVNIENSRLLPSLGIDDQSMIAICKNRYVFRLIRK